MHKSTIEETLKKTILKYHARGWLSVSSYVIDAQSLLLRAGLLEAHDAELQLLSSEVLTEYGICSCGYKRTGAAICLGCGVPDDPARPLFHNPIGVA